MVFLQRNQFSHGNNLNQSFKRSFVNIVLILFSLSTLFGCTRPEDESTSIQISIPEKMKSSSKLGSQSIQADDVLSNVIVNVTGAKLANPILYTLERCSDCPEGSEDIPSTISIKDLPMGADVLVQVLAVYENETTDLMQIYYGDQEKKLSSANENVPVLVKLLPNDDGLNSISGRIAGRFLNADGTGPTGQIEVTFNPGNGKQKMLIEKNPIIAGWFQIFALDNVKFEYLIAERGNPIKQMMFGGAVNLNSDVFSPSTQVVKAYLPVHQYSESGPSGTTTWYESDPNIFVWGWFGNATQTAGKAVLNQVTATSENFSRFRVFGSSTALQVNNTGTPSKSDLLNTTTPISVAKFNGGVSSVSGAYLLTYQVINKSTIENGNDNSAGFRVPFQYISSSSLFNITSTGTNRTVTGKVLPGAPLSIDTFRAFKKTGVGSDFHRDRVNCQQISNSTDGFTLAHTSEGVVQANNDFSITLNLSDAEVSSGAAVVLCGVKNGIMYETGAFLPPHMFTSSGGGSGGVATKLELKMAGITGSSGTDNDLYANACVPVRISLLDANNLPATNPAARTVNFTLPANGNLAIGSCSGAGAGNSATFTTGQNQITLFYTDSGTSGNYELTAASSGLTSAAINYDLNIFTPSNNVKLGLIDQNNFQPLTQVRKFECNRVYLQYQHSTTGKPVPPTTITPEKTISLSSSGLDFKQENCTTTLGTPMLNHSSLGLGIQVTSATGGNIDLSVSHGGTSSYYSISGSPSTYFVAYSVPTPGPINKISFSLDTGLPNPHINYGVPRGLCLPLTVTAYDSTGFQTDNHTGFTFDNPSGAGYTFFNDNACANPLANGTNFVSSFSKRQIYLRINSTQTENIDLHIIPNTAVTIMNQERPVIPLKFRVTGFSPPLTVLGCNAGGVIQLVTDDANMDVITNYSNDIQFETSLSGAIQPHGTTYSGGSCSGGSSGNIMSGSAPMAISVSSTSSILQSGLLHVQELSGSLGISPANWNLSFQVP